tara:strand:+ start:6597 stop:7421 length:825 start_codon:yes stop_codon:yes gene_type:complete
MYGLIGLGIVLVHNASHVVNFAQGDLQMLGGMSAVALLSIGLPLPVALLGGVLAGGLAGLLMFKFTIEPAGEAGPLALVIITLGVGLVLRGAAELVWGQGFYSLPTFSGNEVIRLGGVTIVPQSLWVIGMTAVVLILLAYFFTRSLTGKAILATSLDRDAATLMGINTRRMQLVTFGLAGLLGAVAGVLIAPIAFTHSAAGLILGLKGFVAAVLGGLGSFRGALVGGLFLGVAESMMAGYGSSDYKNAIAYLLIVLILIFMPRGIFGGMSGERV